MLNIKLASSLTSLPVVSDVESWYINTEQAQLGCHLVTVYANMLTPIAQAYEHLV